MTDPWRPTRIALGSLGIFTALFLTGGAIGWWEPASYEQAIGEVSRWCERVSAGWLREPVNTLGNLGFVAAGLIMFGVLARDERDQRTEGAFYGNRPTALLYAGAVVFLGPGSMVMHGSHTFFGAWIDNLSMVAYITIPWLYNVSRLGRWSLRAYLATYSTIVVSYGLAYWLFGPDLGIGLNLFGVSIALWIISEILLRFWSPAMRLISGLAGFGVAAIFGITPLAMLENPGEHWWVALFWIPGLLAFNRSELHRRYTPWFWAGLASFMLAYVIWTTGTDTHELCNPDSLLQAHAIWHLLSAVATWCFFKFLRTETPTREAHVPSSAGAVDNA